MAGFAVFMTVITDGFFSLLAAAVLSFSLRWLAKRTVRDVETQSSRLISVATFAPFLGLIWLMAALLIHVQISNRLAHQDCGFSPDPYVTLPNGYILGSLNTYDGYIVAPGFTTSVPFAGPGYVRGLQTLEYENGYFTGTQFERMGSHSFVFDTRTREYLRSPDQDPKTWQEAMTSAPDKGDSYWVLYAQSRHRWPNYVLLALIAAGEGAIIFWVWKLWVAALTGSDMPTVPTH